MALIKCSECGREISDKAEVCPGCGAPVFATTKQKTQTPTTVHYNSDTDTFTGTMVLMVKLAMRAIQEFGWKLDQAVRNIDLFFLLTPPRYFLSFIGLL